MCWKITAKLAGLFAEFAKELFQIGICKKANISVTIQSIRSNQYRKQLKYRRVEITDEILMQHVKDGHLQEMSVLFERYHVRLYNFFLKLTADRPASQDLTQNLFYRILKYRHTYKADNSFKSWIYQMARNVHIDFCKQQQKFSDRFLPVENHSENISDEDEAYTEDDFERFERAFSKLNSEQKEIIVLSRYQGLKYEEISKLNNLSVAAIKVQVHRAIKQLRTIYFKQI